MKGHRFLVRVTLALASIVALCSSLAAQDFRGAIVGTVTDASGAIVANATVTVQNTETTVSQTATSDARGQYQFRYLNSGTYSVKAELAGFKTFVHPGIQVRVGDALRVDVALQPGGKEEVIEVQASTPLLDTTSGISGQVIDSNQIAAMPLGDGTAYMLSRLAPGVADSSDLHFARPMDNGNLAGITVNGAQGGSEFTLDGAPNRVSPNNTNPDNNNGVVGFSPPSDAIAEFKVQTNAFDAQSGRTAGATVNLALKSGTNRLHGSASYFNRDGSRTAKRYFAQGSDKPTRSYNRMTGTLSGPVIQNNTFFLVGYEHLRDVQPESALYTVPTMAMRSGDFSQWLAQGNVKIYDPVIPAGSTKRVQFAGNRIPENRIDAVARNFVKYYPEPNREGMENNYYAEQIRPYDYDAVLARFDHNLKAGNTLFVTLYTNKRREDRYNWAKGAANATGEGAINGFEVTHGYDTRSNAGAVLGFTSMLSSKLVLDIRGAYSRFGEYRAPTQTFDPATLGFTPAAVALMGGYQYLPLITFGGASSTAADARIAQLGAPRSDYGSGFNRPFHNASIMPTFTWLPGSHSVRFGYEYRRQRWNIRSAPYAGGRFYFRGNLTREDNAKPQDVLAQSFAQFLLGLPTTGLNSGVATANNNSTQYEVAALADYRQVSHGFFLQDDWRLSRKLTLNLGLRIDMERPLSEAGNRNLAGFDTAVASPIEDAAKAAYTANPLSQIPASDFKVKGGILFANGGIYNTLVKVQPRVAAAYLLNEKTVLRAGLGLFSFPYYFDAGNQAGFSQPTGISATDNNGTTFNKDANGNPVTLTNPIPTGGTLLQPVGSARGLATSLGVAVGTVLPPERKSPYYTRWQVGVQRELGAGWRADLTYVGSHGWHLPVLRDINTVSVQYLTTARARDTSAQTFLSAPVTNPFKGLIPSSTSFNAATIERRQLLKPYPQFGDIKTEEYIGTDSYHAGTIGIEKRFSKGNSLTVNYTYSRLRDRVNLLNGSDLTLEDRVGPDDRPHRFTLGATIQLPFGKGERWGNNWNGVVDGILGGWKVSATYQYQSGNPFTWSNRYYVEGRDPKELKSEIGKKKACGVAGVDKGCPAWDISGFYFHDATVQKGGVDDFDLQRADQRIQLADNVRYFPSTLPNVRRDNLSLLDVRLSKSFTLSGRIKLQILAEFLNALNYTVLWEGQTDPTNGEFGRVNTDRNNPRDLQIGAKLTF